MAADEWPKWRGPNADGISHETGLLQKWPENGPAKVWSAKVGLGFSSPIAQDGKVYLFSQDGNKDVLAAFDADSGKLLWGQAYNGGYPKDDYAGSRSTPTIDGDRIYTFGGGGDLVCRQLSDGKEIWHLNVLQVTRTQLLQWGQASSPLVGEKAVFVQCGMGGPLAVAVDKMTGKSGWRSERTGQAGYAAPILMDVAGGKQLIVFAGNELTAMNPENGKTLWTVPWPTSYGVNAGTPIAVGDKLFVSSGYNHGAAQFQVGPAGAKQVWMTQEVQDKFPAAVYEDGYLYCNSEDHSGTLKCLNWADGKVKWAAKGGRATKLGFGGSFVRVEDKLITMSQNGLLSLMKATPEGVELISQAQVFPETFDRVWSTPMIYHGKLYAKGQSELACFDISGAAGAGK